MKVVIAGGGTGGHVFPALAVGRELKKRGAELLFVGTKKGLESLMVPKRGWKIEYLSAPKWKGERILGRMKALIHLPLAVSKSIRVLSKYRPDVVIGVGGYVSAPILLSAIMKGIPTLLMEQNSVPGVTNRMLSRFAKKICVSFPTTKDFLKSNKVVFTGNPVREEIRSVPRTVPPIQDKFVLMCFGGSQGAKSINEAVFASLRFMRNRRRGLKIIHQIGSSADLKIAKDIYSKEGVDAEVYRFIDNIADMYGRAHLVICRAGATSIAELTVTARPAVLVPYPFSANDHQIENARYIANGGGAEMVLDKDLTGEKVSELVMFYMDRPRKLAEMSDAMKKMARPEAAELIVDECLKLCA